MLSISLDAFNRYYPSKFSSLSWIREFPSSLNVFDNNTWAVEEADRKSVALVLKDDTARVKRCRDEDLHTKPSPIGLTFSILSQVRE